MVEQIQSPEAEGVESRILVPPAVSGRRDLECVAALIAQCITPKKVSLAGSASDIPPNSWGGRIDVFLKDGDAALEELASIVNQRLFRHE